MDILGQYYRALNRLIHAYISVRYANRIALGRNVMFYGRPLLRILADARAVIGEGAIFVSIPSANMVGLTKRSSIAVWAGASLDIGAHSGFSAVSIVCSARISIGRYCNFGGNVCIWDTDFHPLAWDARRDNSADAASKPIRIGDDVFVGANSIILKGVEIGDRSVIGAGSVVSGHIPADEVWAGNPARLIRKL
jgi:acetyltransferase-like isoleucine patch superfamily enzyme